MKNILILSVVCVCLFCSCLSQGVNLSSRFGVYPFYDIAGKPSKKIFYIFEARGLSYTADYITFSKDFCNIDTNNTYVLNVSIQYFYYSLNNDTLDVYNNTLFRVPKTIATPVYVRQHLLSDEENDNIEKNYKSLGLRKMSENVVQSNTCE